MMNRVFDQKGFQITDVLYGYILHNLISEKFFLPKIYKTKTKKTLFSCIQKHFPLHLTSH